MREHPIIFTAESVRAIQADRKTQTRRLIKMTERARAGIARIKAPPITVCGQARWPDGGPSTWNAFCRWQPGDHLWIKETWLLSSRDGLECSVGYAARLPAGKTLEDTDGGLDIRTAPDHKLEPDPYRWRSPLFMPRWASRVTLEVVSVRAERLHDISVADIQAEGIALPVDVVGCPPGMGHPLVQVLDNPYKPGTKLTTWTEDDYWRSAFACAWDKINKRRSPWSRNDYVWRTEFRRLV